MFKIEKQAAQIAADYKWTLYNLKESDSNYEQILSDVHLRSAERLKEAFCKNGGAFIKVGQYIGSLDYLLPREYVQTMKTLHDKAPESDLTELYETIETDLKCKVNDIFKEIDEKPIGTASLAQCHRAVLKDGTVVAVKIQHPKVRNNSVTDIKTMLVRAIFFMVLMAYSNAYFLI
jgi:aarF domain-containing kinase